MARACLPIPFRTSNRPATYYPPHPCLADPLPLTLSRKRSGPNAAETAPVATMNLPSEIEATRLLPAQASAFLTGQILTQRRLPPSCLHGVTRGLADLHAIAIDAQYGAAQQQLAAILLLTAPRWLWPEPPTPAQGNLPPQARPRLIQARLLLLHQGEWAELLAHLTTSAALPSRNRGGPPTRPGLLDGRACRGLVQAADTGRTHAAWRKLHTCGLAAVTSNTLAAIKIK